MNRKKIFITLGSILSIIFLCYYIGIFDRLEIRRNSININVRGIISSQQKPIKLYFVSGIDTLQTNTFHSNKISYCDWYAEDAIELIYNHNSRRIKFKELKLKSWEKYNCNLDIHYKEKEIVVTWNISTIWSSNNGVFVFIKPPEQIKGFEFLFK